MHQHQSTQYLHKEHARPYTFEELHQPVDEDLFIYCFKVFTAAGQTAAYIAGEMSVQLQLAAHGISDAYADKPEVKGMLAVGGAARTEDVGFATHCALIVRIHCATQLLDDDRFAGWTDTNPEGQILVSSCLLRACARAPMRNDHGKGRFEPTEVLAIAAQINQALFHQATTLEHAA